MDEALAWLDRAGARLGEEGALDQAPTPCRQALLIEPGYAEAHNTLGSLLRALGRLGEGWRECGSTLATIPGKPGLGRPFRAAMDRRLSWPPARLGPLLAVAGRRYVSAFPVFGATAEITVLADTRALVSALDRVISVDTAVAPRYPGLGIFRLARRLGRRAAGAGSCLIRVINRDEGEVVVLALRHRPRMGQAGGIDKARGMTACGHGRAFRWCHDWGEWRGDPGGALSATITMVLKSLANFGVFVQK